MTHNGGWLIALILLSSVGANAAGINFEINPANMPNGVYVGVANVDASVTTKNEFREEDVPAGRTLSWQLTTYGGLEVEPLSVQWMNNDTGLRAVVGPGAVTVATPGSSIYGTVRREGQVTGFTTYDWNWAFRLTAKYKYDNQPDWTEDSITDDDSGSYEIILFIPPPPGAAGEELESCKLDAVVAPHERISN